MREVVFALEFRGRAGPMPGTDTRRRARTTAPSQVLRTALGTAGVESAVESIAGDHAVLESEVESLGDGAFTEWGSIRYGSAGSVTFETVGQGILAPPAAPGVRSGAVIWKVTGGDGRFAGAQGLIVSNFTVSPEGLVTDNHFARLYLPS
ncbi:MAG: hypothetical protein L0027_14325 [Candidatus Rokubacteria bacterium]|nr:hypothetical protein [Candidatus Rokubacteria bacterium]